MDCENPNPRPYFDSKARMLDFCKKCYVSSDKIRKKYHNKMKELKEQEDMELLNFKPKPWWRF